MTPDEIDALRRELEAEIADCRDAMGEHHGLCDACKQHQRTLDALAALQQEQARLTAERDDLRTYFDQCVAELTADVARAEAERDEARRFVEDWCAIRNVSPADTAAVLRGAVAAAEACVPYLSDGETPVECIKRHRADAARLREALEELGTLCEIPPSAAKAVDGIIRRALAPAAPSTEQET